jgi:NADPH:quinone reductase-like Zn-dependent oxidoreductase
MKAIVQNRYGPTEVLEFADIDQPAVGADDVLIEVRAAGVDQGVVHLMTGKPYLMRVLGFGFRAPRVRVRGMDVAGIVAAVGANVTRFQAGDEVLGACDGSFAEYACTRADRLVLKPANLTFEQAAAITISGLTALQGLRQGQVQSGQKVLVIGAAGGVGTYTVQLAKAFGAEVTGVCSTAKMDLVRSIGADEVIDYTREDFTGPYDLILDIAGNRSLSRLRRALTPKGTLVIVGGEAGGSLLGGTERLLRAALLSPFVSQKLLGLVSKERLEDLQDLTDIVASGKVTPAIDSMYTLGEVPAAIRQLQSGTISGKIVITV